jgi:GNAT superfamily N-acetyltransferase
MSMCARGGRDARFLRMLEIEERSLNAWPALSTLQRQGCILRFADGYTKRSNSANALYLHGDAAQLIAYVEAAYGRAGQPAIFKILGCREYGELDAALEARGYRVLDRTTVQTVDLRGTAFPVHGETAMEATFSAEWIDGFIAANHLEPKRETVRRVLGSITVDTVVASIRVGGRIVAFGFAALDAGSAGFFDIFVLQEFRGAGYGRKLMESLMAQARNAGAEQGYLQVMDRNAPALALYGKLGFEPAYAYWYRVRD